jgi:hypothetical protein
MKQRRPAPGGAAHMMVCARACTCRLRPEQPPARSCAQSARFRLLTARLHRLGERPVGQVLAAALDRLSPEDQADVLQLAEEIATWPPGTIAALGADRWPPPPLTLVAGGRP